MATIMTTNAHLVTQNAAAPIEVTPITPPLNHPSHGPEKVDMHAKRDPMTDDPQHDADLEPTQATLASVVEDMSQHFEAMGRNLNISIDREAGLAVLKVTNKSTGETIRQIPSDEALEMAKQRAKNPDAPYPFIVDTRV